MKVTKENFRDFISAYEEDELFYRDVYLHETQHPETFSEYLETLDKDYIIQHKIFIPAIHNKEWVPYIEENDLFVNIPGNILLSKHYRYTPVFTHQHEFFEILCVYEGTVNTTIQGIQHMLKEGDICIIPPNTKHSIGIFDNSTALNIIVRASTFQSTFFQTFAEDSALSSFFSHVLYRKTEGNYLIFHTGEDADIRSLIEDLYIEYLGHQKYYSSFLNSILMMLWARLLRYHEHDMESILTKEYGGASITEILNYLNKNYHDTTLHEAAGHFGYSTSHFSTLIKSGTGRTFLQIIKDIKLSQACRALRETTLSTPAICELVGYESPEHFMRTFKKVYGMTPGEFRKQNG